MVPLWRRDPVAFLHESARLDPPVLSVAALAPRDGFAVRTAGRGTLNLAEGVPMQLMLTHANRDPAVFFRPDVFDPGRPHLEKVLSWNGLLGQVKAGLTPRGCPGYALSLDVARLLVEAALPGEHEAASPPLASANQLDAEATLVGVAHMRQRSQAQRTCGNRI
ncbi:hypothetical protein T492DRAFT_837283 [Pavlovales sp. CCMP2436]|nr:hypothetical protein T492DRAFT_837283 [Pavlovales sp. CCMP2436]